MLDNPELSQKQLSIKIGISESALHRTLAHLDLNTFYLLEKKLSNKLLMKLIL